jgi:flagellar hook-length control protein FliK
VADETALSSQEAVAHEAAREGSAAAELKTPDAGEPPQDVSLLENAAPSENTPRSKEGADEAGRSSAAPRSAESNAVRLSPVDRVRFVQRVARAVEASRPDGEIRLRLRPPELGSIHLRVRTEEGALTARVETETRQAQSILAERVPELRERLAEMNIRLERFEVEWRGGGDEQRSSSFAQQNGPGRERDFGFLPQRGGRSQTDEGAPPAAPVARRHRGDLDVVV